MTKLRLALALFALVPAIGLVADSSSPSSPYPLPAEERFVYARTIGDKRDEVEIRTRLVSSEGATYRELTMRSSNQDGLFKLDPATLFATYSDITTRGKDATIRRVTTIEENRAKPKGNEVFVSGVDSLGQTLRLIPWERQQKAKLVFVGSSGGDNFNFELSVSGKETIVAGGRGIECWKVQLGLSGIFGGLMGKTSLWFTTGNPSFLVKSSGPSAGPGSPTSLMELESYSSSGQPE